MTRKQARKKWNEGTVASLDQIKGTWAVTLLGVLAWAWWLRGDSKFITSWTAGWPAGVNHLKTEDWGWFYLSLCDDGIRFNYNHHKNRWYVKPIRDVIKFCKDGTWIGTMSYLGIPIGKFVLEPVMKPVSEPFATIATWKQ